MRKQDEIKQKIEELRAQARVLLEKNDVTAEEIQGIRKQLEAEEAKLSMLEAVNKTMISGVKLTETEEEKREKTYKQAFFNMLRGKDALNAHEILVANNKFSSELGEDGGYLIPVDQQTKINELRKESFSFRNYCNVEGVSTKTGSRVIEKDAEDEEFVNLTEGETIASITSPKFQNITYKISDYAGILPIPNNLKNDSDVNLEGYINKWLARKSNATENKKVMEILNAIETPIPVKTVDDIKMAVNTKINPIFKPTLKIFMNTDAFTHFSREKDGVGRYLLELDPKRATGKVIDGVQIIEVPNKILKTEGQKTKIFIGDMKEFITLFDRQALTLLSTQIGGDAFTTNTTAVRAITRFDVQKFDTRAMIACELDLSTAEATVASSKAGATKK